MNVIMILRCKSFVEIKSIPLAWYAVSFLSRIHQVLTCMTLIAISRKSAVHCQKSFRFKSLIGRVDAGISCVILWFHLAVFRAYATFKDTIKSSFDKLLTILSIIPGLISLEQLLFFDLSGIMSRHPPTLRISPSNIGDVLAKLGAQPGRILPCCTNSRLNL